MWWDRHSVLSPRRHRAHEGSARRARPTATQRMAASQPLGSVAPVGARPCLHILLLVECGIMEFLKSCRLRLWSFKSGREIKLLKGHKDFVRPQLL